LEIVVYTCAKTYLPSKEGEESNGDRDVVYDWKQTQALKRPGVVVDICTMVNPLDDMHHVIIAYENEATAISIDVQSGLN
jgi:hypothetical protein